MTQPLFKGDQNYSAFVFGTPKRAEGFTIPADFDHELPIADLVHTDMHVVVGTDAFWTKAIVDEVSRPLRLFGYMRYALPFTADTSLKSYFLGVGILARSEVNTNALVVFLRDWMAQAEALYLKNGRFVCETLDELSSNLVMPESLGRVHPGQPGALMFDGITPGARPILVTPTTGTDGEVAGFFQCAQLDPSITRYDAYYTVHPLVMETCRRNKKFLVNDMLGHALHSRRELEERLFHTEKLARKAMGQTDTIEVKSQVKAMTEATANANANAGSSVSSDEMTVLRDELFALRTELATAERDRDRLRNERNVLSQKLRRRKYASDNDTSWIKVMLWSTAAMSLVVMVSVAGFAYWQTPKSPEIVSHSQDTAAESMAQKARKELANELTSFAGEAKDK